MAESYKAVYQGGEGEITEKKSRFLATVRAVETEEEALLAIDQLKKKYWDATHNCYAYVIGKKGEWKRCSDDGEPSGTAGKPMLDILTAQEIKNVLVVVTRYFGGTLLGTGGLVRAYQSAVLEGLSNSSIIEKSYGAVFSLKTDYNGLGKIQYIIGQRGYPVLESEYTEQVMLKVLVPFESMEEFRLALIEATNGKIKLETGDFVYYASIEGRIKVFEAG